MCLILLAWRVDAARPLVVAANRDEYHARPARPARFWPEHPMLLAGRDLQGGGSWLGITRTGRFAAVTNFREPQVSTGARSRGELCIDFLLGSQTAGSYCQKLSASADDYGGYNLLLRDERELRYYSNQQRSSRALGAGVYGMSNGYLDESWPKVASGKEALRHALAQPELLQNCLQILADRSQPHDHHLPDTGVGLDFERLLAPRFILSETYGTRVSTALSLASDGVAHFVERSFQADGSSCGQVEFEFDSDHSGRAQ